MGCVSYLNLHMPSQIWVCQIPIQNVLLLYIIIPPRSPIWSFMLDLNIDFNPHSAYQNVGFCCGRGFITGCRLCAFFVFCNIFISFNVHANTYTSWKWNGCVPTKTTYYYTHTHYNIYIWETHWKIGIWISDLIFKRMWKYCKLII